jgi:L,D-peptidoglycan transpeptidase YkuD (ErfK/YbiS/YcfS/YnhG family)
MGRHRRWRALAMMATVVLAGCGGSGHATVASSTPARSPSTTASTVMPSTTTVTSTTVVPPATTTTVRPTTTTTTTVAHPTTSTTTAGCPATLAGQLASTGGGSQLITVVAASPGSTSGTVTLWQRAGACWAAAAGPWTGDLGSNGISATKVEGDGTTPIGLFGISSAFYGNAPNPGVHGSYHLLVCGDWWDEEPASPEYNTFQHVASCSAADPFGGGSEALWTETAAYQSFAVVEYNTDPIIAGKGSAIFIHDNVGGPTNGCVSLPPSDLDTMLRWLQPGQSPHIAIGTTGDIRGY